MVTNATITSHVRKRPKSIGVCSSPRSTLPAISVTSPSLSTRLLLVDVDASASERIDPAPAAGYVQELEVADGHRQSGVDDEVVADRLETEHRPQEQERRPRRPGLRTACGGVLHRVLRKLPRIAAESLRQAAVEELGGVEDAGGDLRGLVLEAVAPEPPGDERVVERPDRADVVADRVVAALALGKGADTPPGEEPRAEKVAGNGSGFGLVDDAAPEQVAVVRGKRVY